MTSPVFLVSFFLSLLSVWSLDTENDQLLPASGFALGERSQSGASSSVAIKIHSSSWGVVDCMILRVMNSAGNNHEVFSRQEEKVNARSVWMNEDRLYISYLESSDSSAPYGTWIIGERAGFDSGIAYWKPTEATLSPMGRQSDW